VGSFGLEQFSQDLRFGLRMLRKSQLHRRRRADSFALGIGANTAIFSVINAVSAQDVARPEPAPACTP